VPKAAIITLPVFIVGENRPSLYSSDDDTVQGTGGVNARLPWHDPQILLRRQLVNNETTLYIKRLKGYTPEGAGEKSPLHPRIAAATPVSVERVQEVERGRSEVGRNLPLSNQVYYGKKQERLVWGAVSGDGRVTVPPLIGPQIRDHLGVFLKQGQVLSW
jgi:hypothetical protein